MTIIYVQKKAKKQLEGSTDWYKKINYKLNPEPGFNYRITFSDWSLELGEKILLENGVYHPDMDQDLESTIESMEEVKVKGKNLKSIVKAAPKKKEKKKTLVNILGVEDFYNPVFDIQKPVQRKMTARNEVYDLIEENYHTNDFLEENFMMNPDSDDAQEKYFLNQDQPKKESVIEGFTVTDNFKKVGYTYHKLDGMLHVNFLHDKETVNVFSEVINSNAEFEKAIKKADKTISKLK